MMLSWKGARLSRFSYGAVFPFASRDDREHVIRLRHLQSAQNHTTPLPQAGQLRFFG